MEQGFNFQTNMDFQSTDFINLQQWMADSIDHIALDAIAPGRMFYTGLTVTQSGQTTLQVGAGRLYAAGQNDSGSRGLWVYQYPTATTSSVQALLPLTSEKLVAVIAYGSVNNQADVEQRSFLINAATGEAQTQAVALQTVRTCNIQFVAGTESPVPQLPNIPATALLVATVTLSPTGIIGIAMATTNELPNLADHETRVTALESASASVQLKTASIATDLSALAAKTDGLAAKDTVVELAAELARAKAQLNLPATYASCESDFFGDLTKTNNGGSGYAAKLVNGLLFPDAAAQSFPLALLNPIDSSVVQSASGLTLPAYKSVARLSTSGYSGDIAISQYQVQTQTITAYQQTNWEYVQGWNLNYYPGWYRGNYWRYYRGYYAYEVTTGYWRAYTTTAYAVTTNTTSITGALLAQTFLLANSMWATALDLYFTSVAATGDVTLVLTKTSAGEPDLSNALATVTVPVAKLKTYPAATNIPLPPVLLEAGTRYAIVLITQGNHRAATVSGSNYTNGTIFYSTDAAYFSGDLTKDLMFTLYGANFTCARTVVTLGAVSLVGGVTDLDVTAQQTVPQGTSLTYQFQINGKWYDLGDSTAPLTSAPQLIPLRVVMLGTSDLAPAWVANPTGVTVSRPTAAFSHWSELRTLSAPSSSIVVQVVVANYNAAVHTLSCSLLSGSNTITPSLTSNALEPDGLGRRFRFTFAPSAITTYSINIQGTRQATAAPFQAVERTDVAQ
jgi:hypothetical protein